MKKSAWSFLLMLQVSALFGQGQVNFANLPSSFVNDPDTDRCVYCMEGFKLTGTNWAAQLWYGLGSGRDERELTMTADPVALFRSPDTSQPGTWVGGSRKLPGTTPGIGQIVTLQVRVWDIARFPTYFDALANGAPHGASLPFDYVVPDVAASPDALTMYGFRRFAFTCGLVPEPSALTLLLLGGVIGCFYWKRKSR